MRVIYSSTTAKMLRCARCALLLAVCWLAAGSASAPEGKCRAVSAHLSVVSSRNASGHSLTTVRLDQETWLPARHAATVLDVWPTTSRCPGTRTESLVVSFQGPSPSPSPGFVVLEGVGIYKVHENQLSWEEAKPACEAEDAHLLILNSDAEVEAIGHLLKRYSNISQIISLGAHDKDNEGQYITVFGDPLTAVGYNRWDKNEPSNSTLQNCVYLHKETLKLHDARCTGYADTFICEQIP